MPKSSLEILKKCVQVCYKHYAILKKRLKSKKAICSIIFPNSDDLTFFHFQSCFSINISLENEPYGTLLSPRYARE